MPEDRRKDFYLYVDEFQNFVNTDVLSNILSEARKYRLCLIMAHQYVSQLDRDAMNAVFGNVGTIISFGIGAMDAELLETVFYPIFSRNDLLNLDKHSIYLKDGDKR